MAVKSPVFEPFFIGALEVKNRIIMPALHLSYTPGGHVNDRILEFYRRRAKGGAGLITVGGASVDRVGSNPLMLGCHHDDFIPGLKKLVSAIKSEGARAGIQLYHAGRYNHSILTGGEPPIAPSPVPSRLGDPPREMTLEDIEKVQQNFINAAVRAAEAGFDLIEISASAGYLICQFLSPLTNRREDEYGGSLENRFRFVEEIIKGIKKALGEDFPISVRMSGDDLLPGGLRITDTPQIATMYERAGVDFISLGGGWHEARIPQLTMNVPEGSYAYIAREIKRSVSIPVACATRIRHRQFAEKLIEEEWCDAINMGRPLIADPDLPTKWDQGKDEDVLLCTGCNQGCFDPLLEGKPSTCTINPVAGYEWKSFKTKKSPAKKTVLIAGGGPAGLNAALFAAERGHHVILFEQDESLGGMFKYAWLPPGRKDWKDYLEWIERKVKRARVDLTLGSALTAEAVKEVSPDVLVVATGGEQIMPDIPGIEMPHVVHAIHVLTGKTKPGKKVVIIGGGGTGVETALYLAYRGTISPQQFYFLFTWNILPDVETARRIALTGTHDITILKRSPRMGKGLSRSTRWVMLTELKMRGVKMYDGVAFHRITEDGVECNVRGKDMFFPSDTVVIAAGARPRRELYEAFKNSDGMEVYLIGDAKEPRRAYQAIHEGAELGMKI